ncbi:trypsin-like peptidase domain-containing protein [Actinoplanes sp. NEAU-A12]|uniref:Trypsin-like peptidase domain-containing protein n=1 Tax=Actinoplanes sandaracinus TaxID=3045177 RepID=A0ABT6WU35_9ACTN|nr:trypsin-like peptidase domain-containing protein [Actinoplanes sandaracinus]MDI6103261.1 trypsin-like peptidase domain-containing protein [Actinoplanes sandaracinus]
MTAPFEPFTPANGTGGARRRAQEWDWQEDRSWNTQQAVDPWSQPQQQPQQQEWPQQQWAPEQQWPQQQQWAPEPQWSAPPQQPVYPQVQVPDPAPEPRRRVNRSRPIIIGLVAALVLVAGWQAFRVESMIQRSGDLAEAVDASQGRTQELEKKLTSVFDSEGVASGVLPSVFRVRAGEFTGTAFAIGQAGGRTNLFTNFHVVEEVFKSGAKQVTLERGTTRIEATIVKVNQGKDLALLRANREIKALEVAAGAVKSGQQVMVVGAPLGLEDSVTTGVISAFRDTEDGPTIQFDAPINPGNSGGPVVNANKQVVGLATAKARDAEGIGLAIPIQTACETLGACGNE